MGAAQAKPTPFTAQCWRRWLNGAWAEGHPTQSGSGLSCNRRTGSACATWFRLRQVVACLEHGLGDELSCCCPGRKRWSVREGLDNCDERLDQELSCRRGCVPADLLPVMPSQRTFFVKRLIVQLILWNRVKLEQFATPSIIVHTRQNVCQIRGHMMDDPSCSRCS